jgi:HK97 gp10 family phage protein
MVDTEITGMDDFFKNLDKMIIPKEKRVQAVNAAADVFIDHLKPNIPYDEKKKTGKHLRDTVTYKPNQYPDGSTDVGFAEDGYYGRFLNNGHQTTAGYHYEIRKKGKAVGKKRATTTSIKTANNGTKQVQGLHFMEHSFDQAQGAMKQAMYDVLKE